jgi:Spy/CpxP family protein refolding chaperone
MKSSNLLSRFAIGAIAISTAAAQVGPQLNRHTKQLNLTPDQQTQASAIFRDARSQSKSIAPQRLDERQAMSDAIKSGNEAQIDKVTQRNAQLDSTVRAIHAKAIAKLYSIPTPDQKTTFDSLRASRQMNARGKMRASKVKNG